MKLAMNLDRELEAAQRIAEEAAALVRRFSGAGLTVERKSGDEPVTEADHAASELIVRRLREAFPEDGVLSEELPDDGARLRQSRVWMVDPIDGTRDFIAGDDGYAVMIGLCVDGRPKVGALAMPATGVVYAGVAGGPGYKQLPDGSRAPLRTSTLSAPPGIRLVASKSHRTKNIDAFRAALAIQDELNVGSVGVKVGLVADGSRDLYVYPGSRTKVWDACAPEAILLSAGGRFTDVRGGELVYTGEDLYNRHGIVASNGPLHDRVLRTLADIVAAQPLP
jgi:3'(2'), 5'-bisphosphate nucleotidase